MDDNYFFTIINFNHLFLKQGVSYNQVFPVGHVISYGKTNTIPFKICYVKVIGTSREDAFITGIKSFPKTNCADANKKMTKISLNILFVVILLRDFIIYLFAQYNFNGA